MSVNKGDVMIDIIIALWRLQLMFFITILMYEMAERLMNVSMEAVVCVWGVENRHLNGQIFVFFLY